MKFNGQDFKITNIKGYSTEVQKLTGYIAQLHTEEEKLANVQLDKSPVTQITNEIQKVKPQIQQVASDVGNTLNNVNTSGFKQKIQFAIDIIKQRIQSLKGTNTDLNFTGTRKQLELVKYKISEIQEKLQQAQVGEIHMNMQDIIKAEAELEKLNNQKEKLEQSGEGSYFSSITAKIKSAKNGISQAVTATASWTKGFGKIGQASTKVVTKIKQMGSGMKSGLKQVLKYAMALFSLRSIYTALSSSANSWLSSQNEQAQQLSANIDYMKYAMGSAFAPVIEYVVNLVYKLMKALQSVIYALTKVNIFASASASSYSDMADSASDASKATKALSGVHSEINNVNSSDSSSSSSSSPSFDLSGVDTELSGFSQKLYDFFSPLLESWNTYGSDLIEQVKTTAGQIVELLGSVWGSFENIITNGTVYTILGNILAIIGDIATAFSNAWNYNGNGDKIVQNLANAFNNLLVAIDNVVQSDGFQEFLNYCSDKFASISEKLASIDWQPLINALTEIGETIGTVAINILSGLVDIFSWIAEHPIVVEILTAIAVAIGVVSAVLSVLSVVLGILNSGLLPIYAIIVAIIAVIAVIILAIQHWGDIVEWLSGVWEAIKETISNVVENIKTAISNFIEKIKTAWTNFWNGIKTVVTTIWNAIVTGVTTYINNVKTVITTVINTIKTTWNNIWTGIKTTVTNVFNGIKTTITNVINAIKTVWNNVWTGVKATVINIWNGIWTGIKNVINLILGGIESFVNGVIKGINKLLSGLSDVANAVGSVIGLDPINLQINTISLPRLAKGNVAYEETLAVFGEYSNASSNPEITAPQSIMEETFDRVLSKHEGNNDSTQPIYLTVNVANEKLGTILLDNLRTMKRRSGKGIEALVG